MRSKLVCLKQTKFLNNFKVSKLIVNRFLLNMNLISLSGGFFFFLKFRVLLWLSPRQIPPIILMANVPKKLTIFINKNDNLQLIKCPSVLVRELKRKKRNLRAKAWSSGQQTRFTIGRSWVRILSHPTRWKRCQSQKENTGSQMGHTKKYI